MTRPDACKGFEMSLSETSDDDSNAVPEMPDCDL